MHAFLRGAVAASCLFPMTSALAGAVSASSELPANDSGRHGASAAFDGLLSTAWAEGEMGVGEGSWIELRLDSVTEIRSISVWPGDLSNGERSLKENGRPHTITVTFDGAPYDPEDPTAPLIRLRDGAEHGIQRVDLMLDTPVKARTVRFHIAQAYAGYIRNDTYVAEIALNLDAETNAKSSRLDAWLASSAGEKAKAKHREEVIELFDRVDTAEFGDRDALRTIMNYATDGAPYLRDRVARDVPYGFRVGALPPDEVAIQALLKLKDANAIPALTQAALRLSGVAQRKLLARVAYFEAFAELNNGGRRNLATWGVEGWEKGALRPLGEPMGIALGVYGDLYVGDVGNHRVQVFDQDGRSRATWGLGSATVSDVWFSGRRAPYVSGNEASAKPGGFTNPVDVDVLSGREADEVYVLDALGRVQVMSDKGEVLRAWKLDTATGSSAGIGGAAHLVLVRGKVVVLWGSEAFVYSPTGTLEAQWTIEEGAPLTAVGLKNGRLALGFRRSASMYGLDGFRFSEIIGSDDLPLGYEAWSLGVDEKGKLWVVTDHGFALKFKKPGKVDYSVRFSEVGVPTPRFAVLDDMLYVVSAGTIHPVDALEIKQAAEEAAAEE